MTDEERLIYQRQLRDAQNKRHALILGEAVEQFVDQNGEQVKYTKANIAKLEEYIEELEGILNPSLKRNRTRRPIQFTF